MASTPPLAGPGPDMGAAGAGVLGEPVGRRRSRLRTYLLLEAAAAALEGEPRCASGSCCWPC
jgi:hypothetical protein